MSASVQHLLADGFVLSLNVVTVIQSEQFAVNGLRASRALASFYLLAILIARLRLTPQCFLVYGPASFVVFVVVFKYTPL